MEYKVLTQQDRRWSGKFSPETLEQTLNSYAAEGWRVVATVPGGESVVHQHLAGHDSPRTRDSGRLTRCIPPRSTAPRYLGRDRHGECARSAVPRETLPAGASE
jgi:hypothetical protein